MFNAAASLRRPQSPTRGTASLEKYIYSQNKKRQRWVQTCLHDTVRTSVNMFSFETVQRVCGQRRSTPKQARFTCAGLNIPTRLAACPVTGKSWRQVESGTKCVKVQWKSTWSYQCNTKCTLQRCFLQLSYTFFKKITGYWGIMELYTTLRNYTHVLFCSILVPIWERYYYCQWGGRAVVITVSWVWCLCPECPCSHCTVTEWVLKWTGNLSRV